MFATLSNQTAIVTQPTQHELHELAALILQCQTWVELAFVIAKDGKKLMLAARVMTPEQRPRIGELLAVHLCSNKAALNQLAWMPEQLRDKVLKRLSFTIRQIGGDTIEDARMDLIAGCEFVSANYLGQRYETWDFLCPDGKSIPVFGVGDIDAIALI